VILSKSYPSSSSSAVYEAKLNTDTGESSCNCPGWRFVKKGSTGRSCKHTRKLEAEAGQTIPAAVVAPPPTATSWTASNMPKPMLAIAMTIQSKQTYMEEVRARVAALSTPDHVLEEKYDGIRWIVRKSGNSVAAFSRPRGGKDEGNEQTITPALRAALLTLPDCLIDGEQVTPGGRSWNVSRIDSEKRFVVFDVIEVAGQSVTGLTYTERRAMLELLFAHYTATAPDVPLLSIPAMQPVSMAAVQAIWDRGGEGAIIKRIKSTYQPGRRSEDWVKVKTLHHETLTITGFKAGKADSTTPWSVTCLRADDGRETTVTTLNNATVELVSKDPSAWIGKRLVIYYTELTDTRNYRHGGWDHLAGPGE
jgi:hypothetical protein